MIYEGTNGIQAMDLLGRKLGMDGGKPVMELVGQVQKIIASAKEIAILEDFAVKLEAAVEKLSETGMHIAKTASSFKSLNAFAFAHPFMEAAGDVVVAWMLLWRAVIAAPKLEKLVGSDDRWERKEKAEKNKNAAFYEGQIRSAEFFATAILPITMGKMEAILATTGAVVEIPEASFGG